MGYPVASYVSFRTGDGSLASGGPSWEAGGGTVDDRSEELDRLTEERFEADGGGGGETAVEVEGWTSSEFASIMILKEHASLMPSLQVNFPNQHFLPFPIGYNIATSTAIMQAQLFLLFRRNCSQETPPLGYIQWVFTSYERIDQLCKHLY